MANIDETLQSELGLDAEIMSNIQQIAKRLYDNVSITSLVRIEGTNKKCHLFVKGVLLGCVIALTQHV